MRNIRITFALFIAFGLFLVYQTAVSNKIKPPMAKTGAPSETTCVNITCHSGSVGSSLSYTFGMSDTTYIPGNTYSMSVSVDDNTFSPTGIFGFEMTALHSISIGAGSFNSTTSATFNQISISRPYVGHINANTNNIWTFEWTAPSIDVGDIIFHFTGNAANNNAFASGDRIHKSSFTIKGGQGTGLDSQLSQIPRFWVSHSIPFQLMVHYQLPLRTDAQFRLLNTQGVAVYAGPVLSLLGGTHTVSIPVQYASGIYILQLITDDHQKAKLVYIY